MDRHLVTGVSGSGGSYAAEYLAGKGEVYGISRWHTSKTIAEQPEWAKGYVGNHLFECDLADPFRICRVLEEVQPDYIFHLASHANVRAGFDNPAAVLRNNIDCTLNLLEAMRRSAPGATLLLCSSSEVYGQVHQKTVSQSIDETWPQKPVSPYAVSKQTQDALGYAWHKSYGVKVIRTRMFTYLNPRRADLFATSFAMQVARIEKGLQSVLTHGNLNSTRTVLDVRDAVRAYYLAATKGIPGEVYNIGGTQTMTVKDFLYKLQDMATVPIITKEDPALMRPADVTLQIPNCAFFHKRTGWKPEISFEDSIRHLLDHCRAVV